MCRDEGVQSRDDEENTEGIAYACGSRGHVQSETAQNSVPDCAPVKTCMHADDEIECDRRCQMRLVHIDGRESAQTDNGGRVERDKNARRDYNAEEHEHNCVDDIECCEPQAQRDECLQVAPHKYQMNAAEQEEDKPQILMYEFGCEQSIWQKEKRRPDEDVEQEPHQFVYPREASPLATAFFACS